MEYSTDKLLESLTDITYQSKQILQEGSSSTFDRLLQLQSRLTGQIGGTTIKISSYDRALIEKVKHIKMDYSYRLSTYPNIHNNKKYDIHAGCNVDFVLESILDHIDNPKKDFDPKYINEVAIAKTFNKLTGKKYFCCSVAKFGPTL